LPSLFSPNFYIRVRYTWLLLLDSDGVAPDADGTRRLHMDGFTTKDRVEYRQEGRPSEALAERFTEVRTIPNGKSAIETGGGHVRPSPPRYGYEPASIPKWDAF
jgi:hypothetical protein